MEHPFQGVILDMDGVVTDTRDQHLAAWKEMLNAFLAEKAQASVAPAPLTEDEYNRYIDGKPRDEGIRSFLRSRGFDDIEAGVLKRLGEEKNTAFQRSLSDYPPRKYADAMNAMRNWTREGLRLALVSSSRNAPRILAEAGIADMFEVRIDGNTGAEMGMPGKPAPDYFLEAAKRLQVDPARAVVVEDAESGVAAGKRGGFGLVIGVDRSGGHNTDSLLRSGADSVVTSLEEIRI
jgi:trehalose 6-phosphate phosphatase